MKALSILHRLGDFMAMVHRSRYSAGSLRVRVFQIAALTLAVALGASAQAIEERAVKSRVPPVYPEIAKRMRIEGVVKVEAKVDGDGKVTDVKVVSGNSMLSPAAADAIRKWRFAPASKESTVELNVDFALK
jgi:TonB family protein